MGMELLIVIAVIVIIYLWDEHAPERVKKRRQEKLNRSLGSSARWDPDAHMTTGSIRRNNDANEAPEAQQNARE